MGERGTKTITCNSVNACHQGKHLFSGFLERPTGWNELKEFER